MFPEIEDTTVLPGRFAPWLAAGGDKLKKSERTRLAMILAAIEFLADNPLDALTVADICKRAGVAHGTFYRYFTDRNHLVAELLGRFVDFLQVQMHASARTDGDPVRRTTAAYLGLFRAHAGLMKCMIVGTDAIPEARRAFQRLNSDWAQTVVRAYVKSGDRAPLEQEELLRRAYALGGMVDQYLTALYVMEDPWIHEVSQDPEAVIDTLTTLWKKGLSE